MLHCSPAADTRPRGVESAREGLRGAKRLAPSLFVAAVLLLLEKIAPARAGDPPLILRSPPNINIPEGGGGGLVDAPAGGTGGIFLFEEEPKGASPPAGGASLCSASLVALPHTEVSTWLSSSRSRSSAVLALRTDVDDLRVDYVTRRVHQVGIYIWRLRLGAWGG